MISLSSAAVNVANCAIMIRDLPDLAVFGTDAGIVDLICHQFGVSFRLPALRKQACGFAIIALGCTPRSFRYTFIA